MSRRPLNDLTIRQLPHTGKQYAVWDADLPSFGLRIARRTKTFVLKKENKYYCLGRWPSVSLKTARQEANRRLALKYFPQATPTVRIALEEYLGHQETRVRHSSLIQIRHHLKRFPDHGMLGALTSATVHKAIQDLTPSQANHAFTIFRAFLNWCVERQYLERSPLNGAKQPHRQQSRDRVLSDDEMAIILRATAQNTQFNNIVQFCIYSAQRRTQVARLQRLFVDYKDKIITWPKEEMKGNQSHSIPLTETLRKLSHRGPIGQYAFGPAPYQAWSRGKIELDKACGNLPHWTLHDLRRTARTNLARLSVSEHIAERILAHAPPKLNSVYNKYLYLPAMQEALLKLEVHYSNLMR